MSTPTLTPDWRAYVQSMRPTQWPKNLLVGAAFFFACGDPQQHLDPIGGAGTVVMAIAVFCLISSGIYIINDLRDIESDRVHPIKCHRPIAAGRLDLRHARLLSATLLLTGLVWAWALATGYAAVVATYVLLQLAYTYSLKHIALVDVMMIAFGFLLRAIGGGVVVNVAISPWLLLCTFLLALFMALCKRRHEKQSLAEAGASHRTALAGYDERLMDQLIAITSSATLVAYAIYTLTPATVEKFGTEKLGLTIPFVVFGLFRYLDLVYRHQRGGRPERILLTDLPTLVNLALYAATAATVLALAR